MLLKSGFICILAALPAMGGGWPAGLPILLYAGFQQAVPGAVMDALRKELDTVMAPTGMRFEWRDLDGRASGEAAAELAVITFRGSCGVDRLAGHAPVSGPLGWAHVSDGAVLPFADIDCGQIRLFLQRAMLSVRPADRDAFFGRALARVVAHELFHVLTQTSHHASSGICKSAFSAQELMDAQFRFGDRDAAALRHVAARVSDADRPTGTP